MKLSRYFKELSSSYGYEIEDLRYDSGGADVLASRLKVKRNQFAQLLPMSDSAPEMVAPAFHRGFRFTDKAKLEKLVSAQPEAFPTWQAISEAVELEPWAAGLVKQALAAPGGERFMLTAAGLEFILSAPGAAAKVQPEAVADDVDREKSDDDDTGEGSDDLGDAGEDYLSDQGFDRRS